MCIDIDMGPGVTTANASWWFQQDRATASFSAYLLKATHASGKLKCFLHPKWAYTNRQSRRRMRAARKRPPRLTIENHTQSHTHTNKSSPLEKKTHEIWCPIESNHCTSSNEISSEQITNYYRPKSQGMEMCVCFFIPGAWTTFNSITFFSSASDTEIA